VRHRERDRASGVEHRPHLRIVSRDELRERRRKELAQRAAEVGVARQPVRPGEPRVQVHEPEAAIEDDDAERRGLERAEQRPGGLRRAARVRRARANGWKDALRLHDLVRE
jgi:hypothetical protein